MKFSENSMSLATVIVIVTVTGVTLGSANTDIFLGNQVHCTTTTTTTANDPGFNTT